MRERGRIVARDYYCYIILYLAKNAGQVDADLTEGVPLAAILRLGNSLDGDFCSAGVSPAVLRAHDATQKKASETPALRKARPPGQKSSFPHRRHRGL